MNGRHMVWSTTHGDTVEVYGIWWTRMNVLTGGSERVGEFRYRVRSANGEIVEQGSEGYTGREAAIEAAERHHPAVEGGDA